MSCLIKIRSLRINMSANEKRLANFILENTQLLRDYSSQQLASAVGVSQSSVVKFSQKLGYRGYPDLKMDVYEFYAREQSAGSALGFTSSPELKPPTATELLSRTKLETVENTIAMNEETHLNRVVQALKKARRIQIYGTGVSVLAVKSLSYHLLLSGKAVVADEDSQIQLSQAGTLGRDDLMLLLSEFGVEACTLGVARQAKDAGATVVSFTRCATNTLSLLSDVSLFTVVDAAEPSLSRILQSTAQQYLIDMLLARVLQDDSE